jgi:hypothetical protein
MAEELRSTVMSGLRKGVGSLAQNAELACWAQELKKSENL